MSDVEDDDMGADGDDTDEDEETLRLQLQVMEAKLKLKQLQKKKRQAAGQDQSDEASASTFTSPRKRPKTTSFLPGVQIPVSPIKDRMPPPDPPKQHTSPARVLLGIDKGLKAKDVSLARPRSAAQPTRLAPARGHSSDSTTTKQSFSDRIAASRLSNDEQEAKQERIRQARTRGFAAQTSGSTVVNNGAPTPPPSSTTPRSINPVFRRPVTSSLSTDGPSGQQSPFISNQSKSSTPASALPVSDRFSHIQGDSEGKTTETADDGSSFEAYSSLHLSKRKFPHTDLVRSLDDKEIYTLPRLLKEVKAPHYDPPDCESDFVVFAIIANKSSPYTTKAKHQSNSSTEPDLHQEANPRNKFMVMTLTDLKWEVDLFLFDTAFTQFWKMTPGTLIAMLNPSIMPPKTNQHNGRFSLKLASSEDSVIEIGTARDLDFCKSMKKDGNQCSSWVNKRKSHFCDYHVELAVEKTRKSRMEVNAMYRPNNTATGNKPFKHNSRNLGPGEFNRKGAGLNKDYESGSQFFMGGKGTFSAATLFDAEDMGRADAMRKRLKEKEKERILGEKLGRLGNGMGAEYLRSTADDNNKRAAAEGSSSSTAATGPSKPRAARDEHTYCPSTDELEPDALDILSRSKKAADVDLRPVAGRKRAFHASATSSAGVEAMGWGGAGTWGLLMPKKDRAPSPEKGQTKLQVAGDKPKDREDSPRKRARFDLEGKGLREPGRDSVGEMRAVKRDAKGRVIVTAAPDSSDDDLDIV